MYVRRRWKPALASLAVLALLSAVLALPLDAQATGTVRGTVTSDAGRPLAGAQVSIPGTGLGTLTNNTGQFLIVNVPAGTHTVRVQMLGFGPSEQRVTVAAGQTAPVTIQLSESAIALEELVVTGTAATVRAREVGNSLDAVSSRDLERTPVVNVEQALGGRSPGVTVSASTGAPGAGGAIKIRGVNTVSQMNSPLIYVDGVRIASEPNRAAWGARAGTSPLQDIPAADIERIEIVKGAAATTLYGTEASGGVIQIFTKKGMSGAAAWNAEVTTGFNQSVEWGPPGDPTDLFIQCGDPSKMFGLDVLNAYGPRGTRSDTVWFQDPTCPSDGSWTQNGPVQRYSLSVRGGTQGVNYFISGNFSDTDGILPTQNSRDGGLRGNFSFSPIEPLSIQLSTSYVRRNTSWVADGNNAAGFGLNVNRGFAGNFKGGRGTDCAGVSVVCVSNRYIFEGEAFTQSDHYITGLTVNYNPTQGLSNRFALGWDYTALGNVTHRPFGHMFTPQGYYWDENTRRTKLSLDYAGSFQNSFGERLASTFSWGAQLFRDDFRWTQVNVQGFAGPGLPTLESGALTGKWDDPYAKTTAGIFLQELIGFDDRLFITAGLRVDGNSAFGENFGLQPYPKLSVAYVLSDYEFWPTHWFDTFKLRGAVGESGKAPGAFDKLRTWQTVQGDNQASGFSPQDIGNPDIGPERTREMEAGFDAGFLNGRLGVELTAYQANTYDALIPVRYPPSSGFLNRRLENVGELMNQGLEMQTSLAVLRSQNVDWRVRANGSLLRSKAVDLDGDPNTQTTITTGLNSEVREGGYSIPSYFGLRITNPDEFAAPNIVRDTVLGSVYPTKLGGLGTTLTLFNALTLDALAEYQGGHVVQNYTGYQNARRGVWYPCYDIQQKLIAAAEGNQGALNDVKAIDRARCAYSGHDSSYWVEKGDFVKLRHVSLTYEIPARFARFANNASVTLAGQNLLTWTGYTGSDPEVSDAADQSGNVLGGGEFGRRDYYQIPTPRTFLLSFKVGF